MYDMQSKTDCGLRASTVALCNLELTGFVWVGLRGCRVQGLGFRV